MRKTLLLICCLALVCLVQAAGSAGAEEAKRFKDKQIEELSKKFFSYSTTNGKESLKLTATPNKEWYEKAYNGLCKNTIVRLTSESLAISIPDSGLILAFLQCPDPCVCESGSILAFFDRKNLNRPLCFWQIDLGGGCCGGCYGEIKSVEAREAGEGAYYVVLTEEGVDHGLSWMTVLFLHLDMKCKMIVLSKFDTSDSTSDDEKEPGRKMRHRFVDDRTVEITTDHVAQVDEGREEVVKTTREIFDLGEQFRNPKSRIFPSKAEKALALVKSGFDVNTRDENDKTFLMIAAEDRSSEVVEALLDKGSDVNAKTKDGYTVLMSAANGGNDKVVTLLLKRGADANAKDANGWTALMRAARRGHMNVVWALWERGASVKAKTKEGWTALKAAQEKNHTEIVEFLKARGAEK